MTRKNGPRIPPFVHPTDDSAFEPIGAGDDIDEDDRGDYRAGGRYGEGGDGRYGAAYDDMPGGYGYGAQRPNSVADIEARYGMNSAAAARRDTYDPFADSAAAPGPRPSHDYGAYSDAPPTGFVSGPQRRDTGPQDPYSAIRNQLAYSDTPDRPPQLPDLGYGR